MRSSALPTHFSNEARVYNLKSGYSNILIASQIIEHLRSTESGQRGLYTGISQRDAISDDRDSHCRAGYTPH